MNVPTINWKAFMKHEREVGFAAENAEKKSCEKTVYLERKLTIVNAHKLTELF